MGLFANPRSEPRRTPTRTVFGDHQPNPEELGAMERRARLFMACASVLREDPLASPDANVTPIGDGIGLEDLVGRITPIFAKDRSLIYWTALRGALTILYVHTWDPESRSVPFWPAVERVMGVGLLSEPADPNRVYGVAPEWDSRLSARQREDALGIHGTVLFRLGDYERYSRMPIDDVLADPSLRMSDAVALDVIAWSAVAALRLGLPVREQPLPDLLEQPGWYIDPLWGEADRYWDGADWTARCRVRQGRKYLEAEQALNRR
jgi:Protein of unknown function (DUF2510)